MTVPTLSKSASFQEHCMANIILSVSDLLQHIEGSSAVALSGSQARTLSFGFLYLRSELWHQGILALTAYKANIFVPLFSPGLKRYKILSLIGDGTYGLVYLATNIETRERVAIKAMKRKYHSWDEVRL